jgi:hypothetical protein
MGAAEKVMVHSVDEIARDAMADTHGDIGKAAVLLLDRLDQGMVLSLAEGYLRLRYPESVTRKHAREAIRAIADRPVDSDQRGHRVYALARGTLSMLMSYPLEGGKPLGEATKAEIRRTSEALYAKGSTMVKDGRWLALVAGALKSDDKCCKDLLTESDLKKLRAKVQHGTK